MLATAVDAVGAVTVTTAVVVTTAEEPQAHAENLATSTTVSTTAVPALQNKGTCARSGRRAVDSPG